MSSPKHKIFNDPVYGFITLPNNLALDIIDHPWFQRLRRIRQLGMSHLVYPGALHTRFHHAMGAMHLMTQAIETLRSKGHSISEEEAEAVTIAILLHDIGHGPFSHALENTIVEEVHHEEISLLFMERLNQEFKGKLDLAIKIFNNTYKKKFLHQLVSSQLDMDRLDYLNRDSFFTGVSEGVVGSERIIKMLDVVKDHLVVEEKGIYSIEKFIIARRLMYWQVYLHKTVVAAELMLINILKRAKELAMKGKKLWCTPSLEVFLYGKFNRIDFDMDQSLLETFARLDDYDIISSVKAWMDGDDKILKKLCTDFINRKLYKIKLDRSAISKDVIQQQKQLAMKRFHVSEKEADYFVCTTGLTNNAYNPKNDKINILFKTGEVMDITEASDNLNISALAKPVKKHVLAVIR
ncbi:MAG TPA: phosphohydrolase [Flavobacteriales bacterium]|nr:phosphohydrolase [Flavobacteriales bacterium]HRE74135.1 HD domain-containing protein [Flavobacteriales bacterium]HRE95171.1 HD domain-containing protein [Flavobacteriales bacterium]HRJ39416.1 HD domain-containing protein [Flavobacteriales bacterium]